MKAENKAIKSKKIRFFFLFICCMCYKRKNYLINSFYRRFLRGFISSIRYNTTMNNIETETPIKENQWYVSPKSPSLVWNIISKATLVKHPMFINHIIKEEVEKEEINWRRKTKKYIDIFVSFMSLLIPLLLASLL